MPSIKVQSSRSASSGMWQRYQQITHKSLNGSDRTTLNEQAQCLHKKAKVYRFHASAIKRDQQVDIFAERNSLLQQMETDDSEYLKIRLAIVDQKIDELRWSAYEDSTANNLDIEIEKSAKSLNEKLSVLISMISHHLGQLDADKE